MQLHVCSFVQPHPVTFSSSAHDTHNVIRLFAMNDQDDVGIAGFDTEGSQLRKTKRQQAQAERESQEECLVCFSVVVCSPSDKFY